VLDEPDKRDEALDLLGEPDEREALDLLDEPDERDALDLLDELIVG